MDRSEPLREQLASNAPDLLCIRRSEPVVRHILAGPEGVWRSLTSCRDGIEGLPPEIVETLAREADRRSVTHLPWPGRPVDGEYRLIHFVHDEEIWSWIALYNRAILRPDKDDSAADGSSSGGDEIGLARVP